MDQRNWQVETVEAWNATRPEPKEKSYYVKPGYEESIPFEDDSKLFVDADFDMISTDGFETIPSISHKAVHSQTTGKLLGYREDELTDEDFESAILERLLEADAPAFNLEMDISAKSDARCISRFYDDYGSRCKSSLNRQIVEDCTFSSHGSVEVPQLTQAGDCSVPNHLRIEQIKQFSGMTYKQSYLMAQVIKSLDLDFRTWVLKPVYKKEINQNGDSYYSRKSLATRINTWARQAGKLPYEAPVGGKATPLYKLAKALNDLERENQEDCMGWAVDEAIAPFFSESFMPPRNEPDLDIPNLVGEYTYLKISRIPQAKEFNKSKWGMNSHVFKQIIEQVDNMSGAEIADTWKEFNEAFSFEQRDRFMADWKRIANSRARAEFTGNIKMCEPMLDPPVEDEKPAEIVETGFEDWQLEKCDDNLWKYSVPPSVIDELNSHFKIA
jgi:hypothetical protein